MMKCAIFLCFLALGSQESTAFQEAVSITDYYSELSQQYTYKFAGTAIYRQSLDGENLGFQPENRIFKDMISQVSDRNWVSCMERVHKSCLVLHGENFLGNRATFFREGDGSILKFPLKNTYNLQFRPVHILSDKGWLLADYEQGTVSLLSAADGNLHIIASLENSNSFADFVGANDGGVLIRERDRNLFQDETSSDLSWRLINTEGVQIWADKSPVAGCKPLSADESSVLCLQQLDGQAARLFQVLINVFDGRIDNGPVLVFDKVTSGQFTANGHVFLNVIDQGHRSIYAIRQMPDHHVQALKCTIGKASITSNLSIADLSNDGQQLIIVDRPIKEPRRDILVDAHVEASVCTLTEREVLAQYPRSYLGDDLVVSRLTSKGTFTPFTLVSSAKKSGMLNGAAIIETYASYNHGLTEYYPGAAMAAWISDGGVWVYAHPRGSAGFGSAWRRAGVGVQKANTLIDLDDVAHTLIERGDAKAGRIITWGVSAGGLQATAVVLKRPDIYAGAILSSPCLILFEGKRSVCTAGNEFGNPEDPEQMAQMRLYSPGHIYQTKRATPPLLIFDYEEDQSVPSEVTDIFLSIGPKTAPILNERFKGAGHGAPNNRDRAIKYHATWLDFARRIISDVH